MESVPAESEKHSDGLIYFMPKKDFLVKMIVVKNKVTSVTLETTAAYPDKSKAYLLRYKGNLAGKNVGNVGIDTNGLLVSSKSTLTSGVSGAFQSIGEIAGSFKFSKPAGLAEQQCQDGTHSFILETTSTRYQNGGACGLSIVITKKMPTATMLIRSSSSTSGIYYRQAEPYQIDVSGGYDTSAILFSPSESPTAFLPISKSFFANNDADFGFTDGMPTKYDQSTDGEVVGLLTIPATVLAAYFSAVGKIFDSFKSNDDKQSEALSASTKLEMAKIKYAACSDAITSGKDDSTLEKLGCGN